VELEGENPHDTEPSQRAPAGYFAQAPWKRLLVLLGGPFINVLFATVTMLGLHMAGTHVAVPLTVGTVTPGSEAARAQLRPGDRLAQLNGLNVASWSDLMHKLAANEGQDVTLTLVRPRGSSVAHVTPRKDAQGAVRIGITQEYVYQVLPFKAALGAALHYTRRVVVEELTLVMKLIRGVPQGGLSDAGRVMRGASEAAAAGGVDSALRAMASLSIALALFHLVPIPALDGGRTLLVLWELITKRRINAHLLTALQTIGLVSLLGLLVWVALVSARHFQQLAR
jgi:regulator of sigma E protease